MTKLIIEIEFSEFLPKHEIEHYGETLRSNIEMVYRCNQNVSSFVKGVSKKVIE